MKTDTNIHTISKPTRTMPTSDLESFSEKKLEKNENNPAGKSALNVDPKATCSVPYSGPIDVHWNSLQPISREGSPSAEFTTTVNTGLKLLNDGGDSFASLLSELMTTTLQIFANLQKANRDMALNELNSMKMDMSTGIAELTKEKNATFMKDMIMGVIEAASAVVQFAGSAYTTGQLKGKIVEQETLFAQKEAPTAKASIENAIASTEAKTKLLNDIKSDDNLTPDLKTQTGTAANEVKDVLKDAKASKDNANTAIDPTFTPEKIKIQSETIKPEVDYINARQQAFSGLTALIKAVSPFVQGSLGAEATTHQISAKEAENSKEIRNSFFKQYMDTGDGYRDGIARLITSFETILKQDAENSLAASRKMV